ncbi:hypothetical protein Bbelb_087200 [Branchiostoma belcheri]|nr:hypothetical protein Bbelb_087200 [Branchiostoma belcheri]
MGMRVILAFAPQSIHELHIPRILCAQGRERAEDESRGFPATFPYPVRKGSWECATRDAPTISNFNAEFCPSSRSSRLQRFDFRICACSGTRQLLFLVLGGGHYDGTKRCTTIRVKLPKGVRETKLVKFTGSGDHQTSVLNDTTEEGTQADTLPNCVMSAGEESRQAAAARRTSTTTISDEEPVPKIGLCRRMWKSVKRRLSVPACFRLCRPRRD